MSIQCNFELIVVSSNHDSRNVLLRIIRVTVTPSHQGWSEEFGTHDGTFSPLPSHRHVIPTGGPVPWKNLAIVYQKI